MSGEAAIPLVFILLLLFAFMRIVGSNNPIQFWHFISTRTESGAERGDINNLGMIAGIVCCMFVVLWMTYKHNSIDPWVLGICLIYLGGVKAFAAWLRAVAGKRYGNGTEELPKPQQAAP